MSLRSALDAQPAQVRRACGRNRDLHAGIRRPAAADAIHEVLHVSGGAVTRGFHRRYRLNQQPAGRIDRLAGDSTIARNGISGIRYERELSFDGSLMKAGTNVMQVIVPAGPVTAGILYDYLRLELDESAPAGASGK